MQCKSHTERNIVKKIYFAILSVPVKLLFRDDDLIGNALRNYIIQSLKQSVSLVINLVVKL